MKSRKVYLKIFPVCLIIISITQTTKSLDSLETLGDPSSPVDFKQFVFNRPYTIRGITINYKVNDSKVIDKIQDAPATVPLAASASSQRWHIGRISRKQYEIVNMLWRRTNVFIDEDNTTPTIQNHEHVQSQKPQIDFCEICRQNSTSSQSPSVLTTSQRYLSTITPSYIEFYYLVEMESDPTTNNSVKGHVNNSKKFYREETFKLNRSDNIMVNDVINHENNNLNENKMLNRINNVSNQLGGFNSDVSNHQKPIPHYSYWTFQKDIPANITSREQVRRDFNTTVPLDNATVPDKSNRSKDENTLIADIEKNTTEGVENSTTVLQNYETIPAIKIDSVTTSYISYKATAGPENLTNVNSTTSKPYDKIKFFELYDSNTQETIISDERIHPDFENDINVDQKIDLEHINQDLGNATSQKQKMIKKHIDGSKTENNHEKTTAVKLKLSTNFSVTEDLTDQNIAPTMLPNMTTQNKWHNFSSSRTASWSEYPFAAVYVYERFQVHCDAGVISPHWLLASGSCLSRHREDPVGDRRSAFVTYCGDSWWDPERINYVKYSIIHPRFSHRDTTRRHLYNIGLIKVVTSMASACNNWAPISLISHQYTADQDGSIASAVGWGLDRYDTRYSTAELPRRLLSAYDSLVYSDTCPGNVGYRASGRIEYQKPSPDRKSITFVDSPDQIKRRAKHQNEEGIRNVYCLALPPYSGEDNDPVHGGLLMVGGNLIALYLQEERRQWGDQSAQYTGIWRLVPWISDIAREPDEADFLL